MNVSDPRHPANPDAERLLRKARRLANLMDARWRVPVIGVPIGLDALIGLIPGVGDVATFIVAGFIVHIGVQLGAPPRTVAQMVFYVLLDALIGAIPLLGDLFDVAFRANLRNVELLERHVAGLNQGATAGGAQLR